MARPKSTKPIKSKTISARMTLENFDIIKARFKTIQAFIDMAINKEIDKKSNPFLRQMEKCQKIKM